MRATAKTASTRPTQTASAQFRMEIDSKYRAIRTLNASGSLQNDRAQITAGWSKREVIPGLAGFDGLVRITPDGILHIHSGVGNLGTYSYAATARIAAEALNYDWEHCIIERGDSRKHLAWNFMQVGSNTSFTMGRSYHAAAIDAKNKLLEIAAATHGGSAEDYELGVEVIKARPTVQ